MLKTAAALCALLIPLSDADAQGHTNNEGMPVEVVATASEFVPRSTTVSRPGHSYTNCMGSTSYFGSFHNYGDSGSVSGTADTTTDCETTFSAHAQNTLTTYVGVNYTMKKGNEALY